MHSTVPCSFWSFISFYHHSVALMDALDLWNTKCICLVLSPEYALVCSLSCSLALLVTHCRDLFVIVMWPI